MKIIKLIGLLTLFCVTFIFTEKVMTITMEQDSIMIKIKEISEKLKYDAIDASIASDTIIPGRTGSYIDTESSYKAMKKIGYFDESLLVYKKIYPEVSIYNNYGKYIISGNNKNKEVSIITIINNSNTLNNIKTLMNKYHVPINIFMDSEYLNNNIDILSTLNTEIYNYGNNGKYTKENLIINNNIINNKTNNPSNICLFINKDPISLNSCSDIKMFSLIPKKITSYNIIDNLSSGSIYLSDNTKDLDTIISYILSKGYNIVNLSTIISE